MTCYNASTKGVAVLYLDDGVEEVHELGGFGSFLGHDVHDGLHLMRQDLHTGVFVTRKYLQHKDIV